MAGRGSAPKPTLSRPNDQARREAALTKVAADGDVRGPELPPSNWPEQTLAWWQTWRTSPMAQTFGDTDWSFLMDTALLHAEMWKGNLAVAAELRLRAAKFGATPEDRMRLKISIDTEIKGIKVDLPAVAIDRRRRLLKAVGDGS